MAKVDLNSDLGESFGAYTLGMDEKILEVISSANIACGFHAGDPEVMQKTVALALKNNVAIGAHPGLPDLVGFGRRNIAVSVKEVYAMMVYQIGALAAFVKAEGGRMQHVKPHGALYNMAAADEKLAEAVAEAVYKVDGELILFGLSGSWMIKKAKRLGLKTAEEVFADRTYQKDGSLTPRRQAGAMITDENESLAQVLGMVKNGTVKSLAGDVIPIKADTICVHGDGEHALLFSKRIKETLIAEGVAVSAFV
ncbi:MAG: LamB/YcsF family protein [Spirochaetales bacterium]|jgi:UPF0271 protein|nr:LamB/YcsF family protein [Spirochaetales bacterium]